MLDRKQGTERVAQALGPCLEYFFNDISQNEQGFRLLVESKESRGFHDGKGVEGVYAFIPPDGGSPIETHVTVDGTSGNVYYLSVVVDDGAEWKCTIAVPDVDVESGNLSPEKMQTYAKDLLHHLSSELQQESGRRSLREATLRSQH